MSHLMVKPVHSNRSTRVHRLCRLDAATVPSDSTVPTLCCIKYHERFYTALASDAPVNASLPCRFIFKCSARITQPVLTQPVVHRATEHSLDSLAQRSMQQATWRAFHPSLVLARALPGRILHRHSQYYLLFDHVMCTISVLRKSCRERLVVTTGAACDIVISVYV